MKRALLLLYIFLSCAGFSLCLAQSNTEIDSLKNRLTQALHDTDRCNILARLSEIAPDNEWPLFASKLKLLAEKNLSSSSSSPSSPQNKKLELFYKNKLATALNNTGYAYKVKGNLDSAQYYYHKGLSLAQELNDLPSASMAINNIAGLYLDRGDMKTAMHYYERSLAMRKQHGDPDAIAQSLNNIAMVLYNKGEVMHALEYYFECLRIEEKSGDKKAMAVTYSNIAYITETQGDVQKAADYYRMAMKIGREMNDIKGLAQTMNNVGVMYKRQGKLDSALWYYNESLRMLESINHKHGVSGTYNNIASLYALDKKTYSKALEFYKKSLSIREELDDKPGMAVCMSNIGNLYYKQNKLKDAEEWLTRALKLAQESEFPERIRNCAQMLSAVYEKQNRPAPALEMFKLYIQMRDSISNSETRKASVVRQMQYEYGKKSSADSVAFLKEKQVKEALLTEQQAQLKLKRNQQYALGGGLLLAGVFGFIMYRRFRFTSEQKRLIEEQKNIVEVKQKEVLDSINYARRIQRSLLAPEQFIHKKLTLLKKQK